jgi:hypothetical protein
MLRGGMRKSDTDAPSETSRKVGLEANTEETKYVIMFRHQNAGLPIF